MRILVTGSRDWTDRRIIAGALDDAVRFAPMCEGPIIVIEGGAAGADTLARIAATARGWQVATMKANWNDFGKTAGHIRNNAMVYLMQPAAPGDICLAFINACIKKGCPEPQPHDSHGVTHCMTAAKRTGMKVEEYRSE